MHKKNTLLVLWIIYGFIFINAINSILYFIVHIFYFVGLQVQLNYKLLLWIIPILTLILYLSTTFFILKNIKTKSVISGIYLIKFPIKSVIIFGIIGMFLNPFTNKLQGLFYEYRYDFIISDNYLSTEEWLASSGMLYFGIGISQWLVLIVLLIFYWKNYKSDMKTNQF